MRMTRAAACNFYFYWTVTYVFGSHGYDIVNGRNDYYSHLANKTYKHLSRNNL